MMKFICAPDSFKESLSAVDAANAMADGIRSALPAATVDICPVGDGGEGTLASLLTTQRGDYRRCMVHDALGREVSAPFGLLDSGATAWVESAAAISLAAIPTAERDVMAASSYGVGELIRAASDAAPGRIVVGVGGSATNDGGCGMAQALGVRFIDASGAIIDRPINGGRLQDIATIDMDRRLPITAEIVVAADVRNPLTGPDGASRVYGPQKGASRDEVEQLDDALAGLAELIRRDVGADVAALAGAGAAGGLGAGLAAFADAELVPGVDLVLDAVDFSSRVRDADLCLTGEGRLDQQSLSGKTCLGVARAAAAADVPVIALVGAAGPGADRSLDAGIREYVVIGEGLPAIESIDRAAELLSAASARVIRRWHRA